MKALKTVTAWLFVIVALVSLSYGINSDFVERMSKAGFSRFNILVLWILLIKLLYDLATRFNGDATKRACLQAFLCAAYLAGSALLTVTTMFVGEAGWIIATSFGLDCSHLLSLKTLLWLPITAFAMWYCLAKVFGPAIERELGKHSFRQPNAF